MPDDKISIPTPGTVWFQDERGVIRKISKAELEERCGFTYDESIYRGEDFGRVLENSRKIARPIAPTLLDKVQDRIASPLTDSFVIYKISDEAGYGLRLHPDAALIEMGTLVMFYGGTVVTKSDDDTYSLLAAEDCRITPKEKGGLARFMSHLPRDLERVVEINNGTRTLEEYRRLLVELGGYDFNEGANEHFARSRDAAPMTLDEMIARDSNSAEFTEEAAEYLLLKIAEENKAKVAWESLAHMTFVLNGLPIVCFLALKDIPPGHPLGFIYGHSYWSNKAMMPTLLCADTGAPLSRELYSRTHALIPVLLPGRTTKTLVPCSGEAFMASSENLSGPYFQAPKILYRGAKPLSYFDLRDHMVQANAVSSAFAACDGDTFVSQLKTMFGCDSRPLQAKAYKISSDRTDIVLTGDNEETFYSIILILRDIVKLPLTMWVYFLEMYEVVLRDVDRFRQQLGALKGVTIEEAQAAFRSSAPSVPEEIRGWARESSSPYDRKANFFGLRREDILLSIFTNPSEAVLEYDGLVCGGR